MPLANQSGGLGGTQPPPQNVPSAITGAAVTPGVSLAQVIARRVVVEGQNGALLIYSSAPPALGNLIISESAGGFTDGPGNLLLAGTVSYFQASSTIWLAQASNGAEMTWYTAASSAGPWTRTALINVNSLGTLAISLNSGAATGSWPQSGGSGITTVAQVVAVLEALGLLTP